MRVKIIIFSLLFGLLFVPIHNAFITPRTVSAQTIVPTPTSIVDEADRPSGPPLSLTLSLLGFCCMIGLIFGVLILGFVVRSGNYRDGRKDDVEDKL